MVMQCLVVLGAGKKGVGEGLRGGAMGACCMHLVERLV